MLRGGIGQPAYAGKEGLVAAAGRERHVERRPGSVAAPVSCAWPTMCGNQPAAGSTCTEP